MFKYLSQEKFLFLICARAPLGETSFKLDERITAQFRNKEIIDFDFFFHTTKKRVELKKILILIFAKQTKLLCNKLLMDG